MAEPNAPQHGLFAPLLSLFPGKPELDKTKNELKTLQKQVGEQDPFKMMAQVKAGFEKDMDDWKVQDPAKRAEYWQLVEGSIFNYLTEKSPEKQKIDAFVGDLENLPELKAMIGDTQPEGKIKGFIDKIKEKYGAVAALFTGGIAATLTAWADDLKDTKGKEGKDGKKKDTWSSKLIRKVAGWFKSDEELAEEKAEEEAEKQKKNPAATEAAKKAPTWGTKVQAFVAQFPQLAPEKAQTAYTLLLKVYSAAEIEQFAERYTLNSPLGQIYTAIKAKVSDFSVSVRDLRLESNSLTSDGLTQIITAIQNVSNPTVDNLGKFLDAIDEKAVNPTNVAKWLQDKGLTLTPPVVASTAPAATAPPEAAPAS
ncbi:hypothetical protein COY07_03920 [Candidatus Peregrinibacteria bacterium CG_4_10_14_0_2_um_filter_43_11]|nr:MAG: hypothetical protein COY07_03920 [Candidatus Peregrinibacteria bacterium CG_4_10_14_0_2_um_filter_43_11]